MQKHRISLETAPAEEPVTLAEAKTHCRVEFDEDDTYIGSLITAARMHLDGRDGVLNQALVTQSWKLELHYDDAPLSSERIYLPMGPYVSLTSIKYYDSDNVQQTADLDDYDFVTANWWGYVQPKGDGIWPTMYDRADALEIVWQAGYGDADAVPMPIKQAMLLHIGHMYENREAVTVGVTSQELPMAYDSLINPYRRVGI